jgi:type IV pilus assembly protein PilA
MRERGFSLIELLIVVAIILVIAAIAIPNLMRARMSANDSSAAASMRMINSAEYAYNAAYPQVGFPLAMTTLGGPAPCSPGVATACLLDNYLATNGGGNGKSGYSFNVAGSASAGSLSNDQYFSTGVPLGTTLGSRSYCSVEDAVIRTQPAGNTAVVASRATCQGLNSLQ